MTGIPVLVIVPALVIAGCSSGGTPATMPDSAPASTSTSTVVATTMPPPSTTATAVDRLAEIEAIFQNLEERRLQALYEGDQEAFESLFANKEYMQKSLVLFDLVEFVDGWHAPGLAVVNVLADGEDCIAVRIEWDYSGTFVAANPADVVEVVESVDDKWGISYSGEGWACEGSHPLSF
jgi:hypothetical protein